VVRCGGELVLPVNRTFELLTGLGELHTLILL
jgi:hypothetical protein